MKRRYPVSRITLVFFFALLVVILAACVRPLKRSETTEAELEETAVFNPTIERTAISEPEVAPEPTKPTPLPTAEVQEVPTQVPTIEPTVPPGSGSEVEPTPISSTIVITTPIDGSLLDLADAIIIGGTGEGLPEGNVAIQVKDAADNILASTATTLIGDNTGLGGAGTWEVSVSITDDAVQHGSVYAFSSSPADGSILAQDTVQVSFYQSVRAPFIEINTPVVDEVLVEGPILVSGQGGGLFEGNVVVQVEDLNGNILLTEWTILQGENVGIGGSGIWETSLTFSAYPGSPVRIVAFSTSPEDGAVIASASVDVVYGEATGSLIHLVLPGENLYRISLLYGVSMADIMFANGLTNADYISAGQQLIIPPPSQ